MLASDGCYYFVVLFTFLWKSWFRNDVLERSCVFQLVRLPFRLQMNHMCENIAQVTTCEEHGL